MARRKKKKSGGGGSTWLITFSDMMTLMLTFFVLLVSMATIDERRRLVVLGSIIGTFGMGSAGFDARSTKDKRVTIEPGAMEDIENLETLKDLLWEDLEEDINFQSNKYVEIVTINEEVFFEPGSPEISERGRRVLDRMLPILFRLEYPILLAGHTALDRDEIATINQLSLEDDGLDPSWRLSLMRVLSVYKHFLDRGIDPDKLMVEAFGKFRPMYSDKTPQGRKQNRRVDIVLDKRNTFWLEELTPQGMKQKDKNYIYKDFKFDIQVEPEELGPEQRFKVTPPPESQQGDGA